MNNNINLIMNNSIALGLSAYNARYLDFIEFYKKEDHNLFVDICLCRGIIFDLEFCQKFNKDFNKINDKVNRVICAKLIMNNIVDIDLINKTEPFCIWYPEIPTKETCINIISKTHAIDYSIAILAILMDWEDIYLKLNIENENVLHNLTINLNRSNMLKHQKGDIKYYINVRQETINENNGLTTEEWKNLFKFYQERYESDFRIFNNVNPNLNNITNYPHNLGILNKKVGIDHYIINKNNPLYYCENDGW